jgi:predicted nucleic acid-binding protein
MTSGLVLDASAAIAVIRREPARSEVMQAIQESARRRERQIVPDFFWLELTNVLIRRHRLTPAHVVEALRDIDDLGFDSVVIDRAMVLLAIDIAGRRDLSTYDAMYLALAEVEGARLLTLDRQLAAAAGPRAIRLTALGPRHLAESPEPYRSEPVDWARYGSYLAKLRAEARSSSSA